MSGATHIVGGFVFAGTLCSFSDINILEKPEYIAVCVFFSLLPDIDTTKSWIGKMFYPVAWLIYHKFGHRTITHSALFFFAVWLLLFSLVQFSIIPDPNCVKIALYSILGHYVFDMITVSGVPLFYPFLKWSCVIPGNPAYRFSTSNVKNEIIVCGICGFLCLSLQPLFAQGFWNSYNRQFATIRHVDRENKNTEFYIICEYSYILNAELIEGEAIVLDSKQDELTLFDRRNVFVLNAEDPQIKIIHTRPRLSTIEKRFEELQFFSVGYDSLQRLLSGKLSSGVIQSNRKFQYIENAITYNTNLYKFGNRFDFQIFAPVDSSRTAARASIARLEANIKQAKQRHHQEVSKWQAYISAVDSVEKSLLNPVLSYYEKNKLQQQLIRLKNRPIEKPVFNSPDAQIAELEVQRRSLIETPLSFSGHITVYTFGYDKDSDFVSPIYDPGVLLAQASLFPIVQNFASN